MKWLVETVRSSDRFETMLRVATADEATGRVDSVVLPLTLQTYAPGAYPKPLIAGTDAEVNAFLQAMLDSAWLRGLRPTHLEYVRDRAETSAILARLATYLQN